MGRIDRHIGVKSRNFNKLKTKFGFGPPIGKIKPQSDEVLYIDKLTNDLYIAEGKTPDSWIRIVVSSVDDLSVDRTLLVDTINEKTPGNGVGIDGVKLKDGGAVFSGNVGIGTSLLKSKLALGSDGTANIFGGTGGSPSNWLDLAYNCYYSGGYKKVKAGKTWLNEITENNWTLYHDPNTGIADSTPTFSNYLTVTSGGVVNMLFQSNVSRISTSAQSVTANTTDITFHESQVDTQGEMVDGKTFIPEETGRYKITIHLPSTITGSLNLYANGSTLYATLYKYNNTVITRILPLTAGNSYTFRDTASESLPSVILLYINKLN